MMKSLAVVYYEMYICWISNWEIHFRKL